MIKVLVSSCLCGSPVRYNGTALTIEAAQWQWLKTHCELIPFCPEVSAGLPTPRAPAEIQVGEGLRVLSGDARIIGDDGVDVTELFIRGAELALKQCLQKKIHFALLTESSPSCGSSLIYDGTFQGVKKPGQGVAAALLIQHGIKVFSQHTFDELKLAIEHQS